MSHDRADQDLDRDVEAIVGRLEAERPVPRSAFPGELRHHLTTGRKRLSRRATLALVAAFAGSGLALLATAAIGLAGAGPLAA